MIHFHEKRNAFSSIFGSLSGSDSSSSSSSEEEEEPGRATSGPLCDHGSVEGCTEHRFLHRDDRVVLHQDRMKGIAFQLWPAAVQMCQYLETSFAYVLKCVGDVQNRRDVDVILSSTDIRAYKPPHVNVLELGAGIGLVGIFASILFGKDDISAHVIITDLPEAMIIIDRNIQANSDCNTFNRKTAALPLPWGDVPAAEAVLAEFGQAPAPLLVLLADCVYWEHLFAILYDTLHHLATHRNAVILMSHTRRWKKDNKFFKMCKKSLNVVMLKEEVSHKGGGEEEGACSRRIVKRIYLIYRK